MKIQLYLELRLKSLKIFKIVDRCALLPILRHIHNPLSSKLTFQNFPTTGLVKNYIQLLLNE